MENNNNKFIEQRGNGDSIFVPGGVLEALNSALAYAQKEAYKQDKKASVKEGDKAKRVIIKERRNDIDTRGVSLLDVMVMNAVLYYAPGAEGYVDYVRKLEMNIRDKEDNSAAITHRAPGRWNNLTRTIPFDEFMKRAVPGKNSKRKYYRDAVEASLSMWAGRKTTDYINAMIGEEEYWKKDTGNFFLWRHTEVGKKGVDGEEHKVEGIAITYNDCLVYAPENSLYALVPNEINNLLSEHVKGNKGLFTRLYLKFVSIRGNYISHNHIDANVKNTVAKMKKDKKKRTKEEWNKEIQDAIDATGTLLLTQPQLEFILKDELQKGGFYEPQVEKEYTGKDGKEHTYTYKGGLRAAKFRNHMNLIVPQFVVIGMLTKGCVCSTDNNIEEARKLFPHIVDKIDKISKRDGVCCIVQFSQNWSGKEPVEVKSIEENGGAPGEE